jgi:two-component system sensor histidine kinase YesM
MKPGGNMGRVYRFIASFFDVKRGIKARIFLSFSILTIFITVIVSIYWYERIRQSAMESITDNMEKMVNSGLTQIENSFQDTKLMHFTLIYESGCIDYLFRAVPDAPTLEWFASYVRLYSSLKAMGITMSRTISGSGVFKTDGSTCLQGVLALPYVFPATGSASAVRGAMGNDIMFFEDKKEAPQTEVKKYIFVGRTILDKGEEKALLVSKINENVFTDAFREASYPHGFTLLLDGDYNIIYDSSPGSDTEDKENFRGQFLSGREFITNKGYTVFCKKSPFTNITALTSISNRYIQQSYRALQARLLLLILAAVLSAAVLSMFISNKITLRLRNLEYNMEKIGDGTMPELFPIRGEDEVGKLSRTYLRMIGQIKKLMEDIKENERQKRQMEIKVLRAQISPHFLYNSLNTIGYLAMMQNVKNIHDLVSSLINLLQAAVKVDDILIPLSDEIDYVKSYLTIQLYRFSRQPQVDFRLDKLTYGCLVPKMILQPIVENALIHGLRDGQENPMVTIKAYPLDANLIISVSDNGAGMSGEKIREVLSMEAEHNSSLRNLRFSGIGIGNVHARIRLQFGEPYGLSIYSREQLFTTVEIRLPVVKEEKEVPRR